MSFKETLLFLFIFAINYNVIDVVRIRWKVIIQNNVDKLKLDWLYLIVVCCFTLMFTIFSCAYAFSNFHKEYSFTPPSLMVLFYIFCSIVLYRRLYLAIIVFWKILRKKNTGHPL